MNYKQETLAYLDMVKTRLECNFYDESEVILKQKIIEKRQELEDKRKNGKIVLGYWSIMKVLTELLEDK